MNMSSDFTTKNIYIVVSSLNMSFYTYRRSLILNVSTDVKKYIYIRLDGRGKGKRYLQGFAVKHQNV